MGGCQATSALSGTSVCKSPQFRRAADEGACPRAEPPGRYLSGRSARWCGGPRHDEPQVAHVQFLGPCSHGRRECRHERRSVPKVDIPREPPRLAALCHQAKRGRHVLPEILRVDAEGGDDGVGIKRRAAVGGDQGGTALGHNAIEKKLEGNDGLRRRGPAGASPYRPRYRPQPWRRLLTGRLSAAACRCGPPVG